MSLAQQPRNITMIGASKGSVIAMLISSRLTGAIRYAPMDNCNEYVSASPPCTGTGSVLFNPDN